MTSLEALAQAQGLLQADLALISLKVDSVVQSMKELSLSDARLTTILKRIIDNVSSEKLGRTSSGGMTSTDT